MEDYSSFFDDFDSCNNLEGNQHTFDPQFTGQQQFDYYNSLEQDNIQQSDVNNVNPWDASISHYSLNDSWLYVESSNSYYDKHLDKSAG